MWNNEGVCGPTINLLPGILTSLGLVPRMVWGGEVRWHLMIYLLYTYRTHLEERVLSSTTWFYEDQALVIPFQVYLSSHPIKMIFKIKYRKIVPLSFGNTKCPDMCMISVEKQKRGYRKYLLDELFSKSYGNYTPDPRRLCRSKSKPNFWKPVI